MKLLCLTLGLLGLALTGCTAITSNEASRPESDAVTPIALETDVPFELASDLPLKRSTPKSRLLIVSSADEPNYTAVADALGPLLSGEYILDRYTLNAAAGDEEQRPSTAPAASIAIGLEAAEHLGLHFGDTPMIFCQVFDEKRALSTSKVAVGVSAVPPLTAQLQAWRQASPGLGDVGIVVSRNHEQLVAEARKAAAGAGIRLHVRYAASDRETLYLFKRLVPEIDGLWLFPDNSVLSPSVLRSILAYGDRHRIQTLVFNPSLLEWGATLSVTAETRDIAYTVERVVRATLTTGIESLPPVVPLTTVEVTPSPTVTTSMADSR